MGDLLLVEPALLIGHFRQMNIVGVTLALIGLKLSYKRVCLVH